MIFLRYFPGFKGERQVSYTDTSSYSVLSSNLSSYQKRAIPIVWDGLFGAGRGRG